MSTPQFFEFITQRAVPTVFMARIRLADGDLADKASFDDIKANVYLGSNPTPVHNDSLIPGDVMFDSLQGTIDDPDPRWTPEYDSPSGYNFLWECPGSAFPDAAHYRVEIIYMRLGNTRGITIFEGPARSNNA